MRTLPLILLVSVTFASLLALYLRWEARRKKAQRGLYESLAAKFGLNLFTGTGVFDTPLIPKIGGVYRGREVHVGGGVEDSPDLAEQDRLFRKLSGPLGPRLRQVREGEFTYLEVKCANPFGLAFYVVPGHAGMRGETEFDRRFEVRFGEGGEEFGRLVLTEGLRRELLNAAAGKWLHSFETLTLVGESLLYIETVRIKRAEQAERFARMLEALCDAADRVDAEPRPLLGASSPLDAAANTGECTR